MILQGRLLIDPKQIPKEGWLRIENGHIAEIEQGSPPKEPEAGSRDAMICPGFVDAHLHPPQFDVMGCDRLELLDWLDRVIYPAETRWSDKAFAETHALDSHRRMLAAGTLGYAGFLTSHEHSVMAITKAAQQIPLRALAGQVLMDRHGPEERQGMRSARLARSEKGRFDCSLNPRFAPACSDDLLADTGRRLDEGFPFSFKQREAGMKGTELFVQTHLAESQAECDLVRELFPDDEHYTGVYDRHGLLTNRTLLAHCVHLADDEWELIAARNCVVVHCPEANTFLQSGVFDLNKARAYGVRLALGSDVGAGCDLAMPRVARAMIEVAKLRRMTIDPSAHVPTSVEAWNLITRHNAQALGFHDMGRIEVGASADLLILRLPFAYDDHLIGRLIHTWRDEYITHRVLNGRLI